MDHSLSQTRDGWAEGGGDGGDGCFPQLLGSLRLFDSRRAGLRPAAGHGAFWAGDCLGLRGLGVRV